MIHDSLSGSSDNSGVGPKFPDWYCSTVWTTVSSRQGLVVEFGWARVRLGLPSFALSPTFSPTRPSSPSLSPRPLSLILTNFVQAEGLLWNVFLFQLYPGSCSALVTSLVVCVSTSRQQWPVAHHCPCFALQALLVHLLFHLNLI